MCTWGGSGDGLFRYGQSPRSPGPLVRTQSGRAALRGLSERLPGSHREPSHDGRSLVVAVARVDSGRALVTTARAGPDPHEMTASLLAWGAVYAAAPDASLEPGVHGPVAALGLDTLGIGAAEVGLRNADESSALRGRYQGVYPVVRVVVNRTVGPDRRPLNRYQVLATGGRAYATGTTGPSSRAMTPPWRPFSEAALASCGIPSGTALTCLRWSYWSALSSNSRAPR